MPFTPIHGAAALPFRRTHLIFSALVAGCFAPDFEDYVRFSLSERFGHTFTGVFVLDLPLALAVLWIFHRYAKEPLWTWLPKGVRERVKLGPRRFPLWGVARLALVLASILIGIATHLLWDSLTYDTSWPYRRLQFFSRVVDLPYAGPIRYDFFIQVASNLLGVVVLIIWFVCWYRAAVLVRSPRTDRPRRNEHAVLLLVLAIALTAAGIRAFAGVGIPRNRHDVFIFAAEFAITAISIFFVETVAYGFIRERRRDPALLA